MQGGSGPAAGSLIDIGVAAQKDGGLVAIEGIYRMDAGGLPGMSPSLLMQASAALYQCPNLGLEGFDVVTNKPRTEAYRGPGGIQAAFAMEQAMDMLCQKLSMDPLEFRKRNAAVTGSIMPIGTRFPSIGLDEHPRRGRPAPLLERAVGGGGLPAGPRPGAWLLARYLDDLGGTYHHCRRWPPMVTMGAVDLSGTRSTMAQVVAEEFGLPIEDMHIQTGDSKSVGYSDGAAGSRVARTMTAALVEACADALAQLRIRAAEKLQCDPECADYAEGVFRGRRSRAGRQFHWPS